MSTFFLDLWHDLKQKRLWPLAVVLLASIPAVPLLLASPAEDPGPPASAPANSARTADQLPLVDLEAVPASSNLETFNADNPFSPSKDVAKAVKTGSGSGDAGAAKTDAGSGSGGGSGAAAKTDAGSGSGSGTGSGGDTSPGSGDSSGGGSYFFTFEIDVRFGPIGDEKTHKGVKALDVLPDAQAPVVTFMGMKDDMKTALFMVLDPGVQASGEGKCSPSPERCTFFELKAKDGKDEVLLDSASGDDYSMRLLATKRVKLDDTPPSETRTKDATSSSRKEKNEHRSLPFFLPRLLERAVKE